MTTRIIKVSNFEDKFIKCCDCGDEFVWTAQEQAYFQSRMLIEPKRCKPCRDYRRTRVVDDTVKGGDRR